MEMVVVYRRPELKYLPEAETLPTLAYGVPCGPAPDGRRSARLRRRAWRRGECKGRAVQKKKASPAKQPDPAKKPGV